MRTFIKEGGREKESERKLMKRLKINLKSYISH